ncbi:hypothetical protein [Mesorhizobium sp. M0029]|uniref:hypothetical protein n=1 Tax=Mesorhizobium sp. M0029 TaxID=2956850 RepID=UPI00333CDA89
MSHHAPLPFRQGELDGLCGIYAVINAIRLALGARANLLRRPVWQDLFVALLESVDLSVGAAHAASNGIDTQPIRYLLKAAILHLATEHDLTIRAKPMLCRDERPCFEELLRRIGDWVRQPGQAVLLSVFGSLNHWTVVRRVSHRSLILFDSSGYTRISLDACSMAYERPRPKGRQHIVPHDAIFCVAATPSRVAAEPTQCG